MKRKFASLVALSMVMTLAFGMTVSAAGSTSTPSTNVNQEALDTAASNAASSAVEGDSAATVTAAAITPENVGAAEEAAAGQMGDVAQVAGGLVTGFDLSITLSNGEAAKNITVKLAVPKVEAGKDYRVLHWNGKEWEVLVPSAVANGSLTVTFPTLSPVVIIQVAAKDTGSNDSGNSSSDSGSSASASGDVSPKTGDSLPMAGTAALLCLTGAVVCAKKARIY